MPQSYTGTKALRVPTTLPDGLPSLAPHARNVLDTLAALAALLNGQILGARTLYTSGARSGSAASNTGVYVGPVSRIVLPDPDGTYRVHEALAEVQLNTGTHFSGALSASTEYFVYYRVAANGAAPTPRISGTAPTNNLWHPSEVVASTTVPTWRYMGSFCTDAAGTPLPFRAVNGVYLYELDAGEPLTDFELFSGDPGGVQVDTSLQARVPVTARRALVRWTAYSTGADATFSIFRVSAPGPARTNITAPDAPGGGTSFNTETVWVPVEPDAGYGGVYNYVAIDGNGGGVANVEAHVLGYAEALP